MSRSDEKGRPSSLWPRGLGRRKKKSSALSMCRWKKKERNQLLVVHEKKHRFRRSRDAEVNFEPGRADARARQDGEREPSAHP